MTQPIGDANGTSRGARLREARRRGHPLVVLAVSGVALASLAACGSGGSSSASAPSSASSNSAAAGQNGPPGVTGTIAAVSRGTVQVQNPQSGQTAVTYTGSTTVTKTSSASRSALKPGVCVTVLSGTPGQGGGASSGSPSTGPIAAQTVTISAPTNGACTRGFGGPGRRRTDASARPTTRPSGGPGGGRFGGANGKVTSVTPDGFVLSSTDRTAAGITQTVTTSPATTYLQTQPATASALVVGQCLTAIGPSDDTGAVAATSLAVRPPGPNGCVGFTGRRGGAAGGGSNPA
jgi:hypothetical protein